MTIKMSPKRSLITTLVLAGAYIVYLFASAADGVLNIPTQFNSMILWILGTAAVISSVIAAWTELSSRNEERRSAEMAEHARHLGAQLDAIRRELAMLSPTQQLPILRVVAAGQTVDAGAAYAQAYVAGLTAQPTNGKVIQLDRRP